MPAFSLTWLPDVLRAAGLDVQEVAGWQSRGRGEMGAVKGVLCHHTAGGRSGNAPSLKLVTDGRRDLPGPLSQLVLGRDGTFFVVAAGRCNHAGAGSWHGVTAGNSSFIGIEAENAGTGDDPWPGVQMAAYAKGVAAILLHVGADAVMAAGHKEYALPRGRKVDPAFDMVEFRESVEAYQEQLQGGGNPVLVAVPPTDPRRAMLRKGDQGNSVRELQKRLGVTVDGAFGPATVEAVKAFQRANKLTADGMVGPKTWEALGL